MWLNNPEHKTRQCLPARYGSVRRLMAILVGGTLATGTHATTPAIAFDKPVRVQRIALPADPANPQAKAELRCFTYPSVLVKEIYRGEVGAELGLIPLSPDRPKAACVSHPTKGQLNVQDNLEDVGGPGYFKGSIGDLLIFSAAEALQGAEGFWVYSQQGNKVFSDLANLDSLKISFIPENKPTNSFQALKLRYVRVFLAQCSLFADPQGCWDDIRIRTGLSGKAPDCGPAYRQLLASMPSGQKKEGKEYPSLIEYEVEVIINRSSVTHMAPVSGATRCWTPE
jgi:hypothetical protein